jgi:hypothetical protein
VSVKIDDKVKARLLQVAGEYQIKNKVEVTISETIEKLISEHEGKKEA